MNTRPSSAFLVLLSLAAPSACNQVGDEVVVVTDRVSERTFEKLGSDTRCYAEVGATMTVVQTFKAVGRGCGATRQPDYYMEYSNAGIQEFRTRHGRISEDVPDDKALKPCAHQDLLMVDEHRFNALREKYERFLDRQKETEQRTAFEKKVIEEQKRKNQVEKE